METLVSTFGAKFNRMVACGDGVGGGRRQTCFLFRVNTALQETAFHFEFFFELHTCCTLVNSEARTTDFVHVAFWARKNCSDLAIGPLSQLTRMC